MASTNEKIEQLQLETSVNERNGGLQQENERDDDGIEKVPERAQTVSSDVDTLDTPEQAKANDIITKDFRFIPIPKYLQYNPDAPTNFDVFLNILFGVASTFVVANLYYCQPLLIQLAASFNVTYDEVSRIPTLVQAGYATGLLLVSPLGDLVRRRPLILLLALLSAVLTIGLPLTSNVVVFEVLSFIIGATSVNPQIMMPLAADLAPPHKRASALSIVLSGLLFGVLLARVLAGIIANFATWRIVYWLAVGTQGFILALLYFKLPDFPAKNKHMTYWGILLSMAKFTVTEPLLIQAVLVNLASMACFTNFWVTLTFLLGGPIYNYSTLVIGLFGLVGMGGVSAAPFIGRVVDKLVPWVVSVVATVASLMFYGLQVGAAGVNVAAVIIVCFGIDVFRQTLQVSSTTAVFGLEPSARSRMNAVLIIFIFFGQIIGTSVGTNVFNHHGWRAAAALSVGWQCFALFMLLIRGPHCKRYTWFGYEGGYTLSKKKAAAEAEAAAAAENPNLEGGAGADGDIEGGRVINGDLEKGRDEKRREDASPSLSSISDTEKAQLESRRQSLHQETERTSTNDI